MPSDQGVQAAEEDAVAGGVPGAEVGCKGVEKLFHRGLHGELEPDHLIGGDVVLQHGRRCGEQFTQEGTLAVKDAHASMSLEQRIRLAEQADQIWAYISAADEDTPTSYTCDARLRNAYGG